MVIGAGSSGVQIADELQRAGKQVYLAVGPHDRPPRSYRGRDFCWWLGVLGLWDAAPRLWEPNTSPSRSAVPMAAPPSTSENWRQRASSSSGAPTSATPESCGSVPTLKANVDAGDANYSACSMPPMPIERNGLDLPLEPAAREIGPDPECMTNPILELDPSQRGSQRSSGPSVSVMTTTGCRWTRSTTTANPVINAACRRSRASLPRAALAVATRIELYLGVWHDAKYLADQIAIQRSYAAYQAPAADSATGTRGVSPGEPGGLETGELVDRVNRQVGSESRGPKAPNGGASREASTVLTDTVPDTAPRRPAVRGRGSTSTRMQPDRRGVIGQCDGLLLGVERNYRRTGQRSRRSPPPSRQRDQSRPSAP